MTDVVAKRLTVTALLDAKQRLSQDRNDFPERAIVINGRALDCIFSRTTSMKKAVKSKIKTRLLKAKFMKKRYSKQGSYIMEEMETEEERQERVKMETVAFKYEELLADILLEYVFRLELGNSCFDSLGLYNNVVFLGVKQ